MIKHEEVIHMKKKQFSCNHCKYECFYRDNIRKHVEEVHKLKPSAANFTNLSPNYICKLCQFRTSSLEFLKSHRKAEHKVPQKKFYEGNHICNACEYKTFCKSSLERHISKKHGETFNCDNCSFSSENTESLKDHTLSIHEGINRFACNVCDTKFYFYDDIKKHLTQHEKEDTRILRIGCDLCESKVPDHNCVFPEYYEREIKPKKETLPKKYNCDFCHFSTNEKYSLPIHVRKAHEGELVYKCSNCNNKYFYRFEVRNHISAKHRGEECRVMRINCAMCEQGEEHNCFKLRSLTQKENFQCNECTYRCRDAYELKKHIVREHQMKVRYECSICMFQSGYKWNLQKHLKKNHDADIKKEIRTICNLCETGKDHGKWMCPLKAETRPKKLKPSIKSLSKVDMYGEKIRVMMPEKAKLYQCRICDYKSPSKEEALEHFKDQHPGLGKKISIYFCLQCKEDQEHKEHSYTLYKENYKKNTSNKKGWIGEFKCLLCNVVYKYKNNLTKHHEEIHLMLLRYSCSLCDYKAFYDDLVKTHQKDEHENQDAEIQSIHCTLCKDERKHVEHQYKITENVEKKHKRRDIYGCNKCNFKSYTLENIEKHQKDPIHENEKDLKIIYLLCKECKANTHVHFMN